MFLCLCGGLVRKLLGPFLALLVASGMLAISASVGAQTPPGPTPAQPPAQPADVLSYVGDILPQRQRDLFVLRSDGSDKKQITQGFNVWFASWSPDGTRLAVTTEQSELYTLNPDGSDLKLLTSG